jgi:hypothetical protein
MYYLRLSDAKLLGKLLAGGGPVRAEEAEVRVEL